MDPFTAIIAIGGMLASTIGAAGSVGTAAAAAGVASQEAAISGQVAGLQMQENSQRQLAMQINARRAQTQIIRQTQQAQANSKAAAVNQGGQFGSGIQGGVAQEESEGAYNLQGTDQNLQIGNALFSLTNQIDLKKIMMSQLQSQQASLQGQAAIYGGVSSFGSSLSGSAGTLGKIAGMFGSSDNSNPNAFAGYNVTGLPQGM